MNPRNQYTAFTLGNGLPTERTYNDFGMLTEAEAGLVTLFNLHQVHHLELDWDLPTGNINFRTNNLANRREDFTYDDLRRLTSWDAHEAGTIFQPNPYTMQYDANGNITYKERVGDYAYNAGKPHAVTDIHNPEGAVPTLTQDITYTPFNKTSTVTEGDYKLEIVYGPENARRQSILRENGQPERTVTYSGNYEIVEVNNETYEVHYITCGPGLVAMNVRHNGNNELYYVYTDHLGSILTLTDESGNIVFEQNFDPWGIARNADDWTYSSKPATPPDWLIRGFTGHEHLPEFGLINMNGRVYDPVLGRVNSPDNFVQEPGYSQSYNRYSYTFNNPLVYTDPDGEIVWAPIIVGAAFGGLSGYMAGTMADAKGWKMAGYVAGGALIGAATGGTASAVSSAGGGAFLAGTAGGTVGNAGFTALSGGSGEEIVRSALIGGVSGGLGGTIGAAIGGGAGAFVGGATGSGLNTALSGGSLREVGTSALFGGGFAYGVYHASSFIGWKFQGGNKMGDMDISYRQYLAMQADFQRSRFWGKEYGGWLLEGGGVKGGIVGNAYDIDLGSAPEGAIAEYHTHWDNPGVEIVEDYSGNWVRTSDFAKTIPAGERVARPGSVTHRYHSPLDLNTAGRPSYVINRYDASYYPGSGNYSAINPPINRFIYSFYFWK